VIPNSTPAFDSGPKATVPILPVGDQTLSVQSKTADAPPSTLSGDGPLPDQRNEGEAALATKGEARVLGLVVDAAGQSGAGSQQTASVGSLAFTGASSVLLGLIALVILLAGSALLGLGSRRHSG
jgi:hypothetical protein